MRAPHAPLGRALLARARRRLRTAEAAAALTLALLLVRAAPWRWWRWSLGPAVPTAAAPTAVTPASAPGSAPLDPASRDVRLAIERACRRLPMELVCLPRAIAMQWMLRRRGASSTLVIGVAPGAGEARRFEMHAWIERGGRIVLGEDPERAYSPCASFAQGARRGDPARAPGRDAERAP